MNTRELTKYLSREISIGDLKLGGKNPIRLQSMTNTNTLDTQKSVEQCIRIFDAGADMVRLTAQGTREAENLKFIKQELIKKGYRQPLIADIHFNPKAAELAAQYIEKVRINPGNYIDKQTDTAKFTYSDAEYAIELEKIHDKILPLIKICKENGTAIRIGTNHGSLSNRIMSRYGDSPEGMANSAMEFLRVFEAESFHNIVLSMKSSNTRVMVYTTRLLLQFMQNEGMYYPLHLGVTEAGEGEDGRIKSAVGIGTLLHEGIGDTIRVSLTEEPEFEIPVAKKLISHFNYTSYKEFKINSTVEFIKKESLELEGIGGNQVAKVIGKKSCGANPADISDSFFGKTSLPHFQINEESNLSDIKAQLQTTKEPIIFKASYTDSDLESMQLKASADLGFLLIDGYGDALNITNPNFTKCDLTKLSFSILQASRVRFTKTEYISCPGCGRTLFGLQKTLREIKQKTSHLKNLKIGVMGCIVNGPGEMADADYGYVGAGPGKITLYKNKAVIKKNIPEKEALDELISIIKENGDWEEKIGIHY